MPAPNLDSVLIAGLAACTAVGEFSLQALLVKAKFRNHSEKTTATNPAEVAKTRLQLQGELVKSGYKIVYHGPFDTIRKTWQNEGIQGIQRGLGAAYAYSVSAMPSCLPTTRFSDQLASQQGLLQICILGM